jgi:polyphosphate glucokinase
MDGRDAEKGALRPRSRHRKDLSWKQWGSASAATSRILEDMLVARADHHRGRNEREARQVLQVREARARLVPAEFLNEAGIVGAALWAERERRG